MGMFGETEVYDVVGVNAPKCDFYRISGDFGEMVLPAVSMMAVMRDSHYYLESLASIAKNNPRATLVRRIGNEVGGVVLQGVSRCQNFNGQFYIITTAMNCFAVDNGLIFAT